LHISLSRDELFEMSLIFIILKFILVFLVKWIYKVLYCLSMQSVFSFLCRDMRQKVLLAAEFQWSRYLINFKRHLCKLSKNLKIIMYIVSDISHNVAKSQPKILLFMGLKKNDKIWYVLE
jgi:hypothetical protein